MGSIFKGLGALFGIESTHRAPSPPPPPAIPAPPPAPKVPTAAELAELSRQSSEKASAAATSAGLSQSLYGGRSTILTGGAGGGVAGAPVRRPGLAPGSAHQGPLADPTVFAKYLGE